MPADSGYATVWRSSVRLSRDCEKLHARKTRWSVWWAWLMSRGSSWAASVGKWHRENPVLPARLVLQVIAAGKTQRGLRTQPAAMLWSVRRPTQTCDSWLWPLTRSSWNISVSSLVILAASVFAISCGKQTDRRRWEPYPRDCSRRRQISKLHRYLTDLQYLTFTELIVDVEKKARWTSVT